MSMGSGIVSMGLILREGGSKSPCRWVTSSGIYTLNIPERENRSSGKQGTGIPVSWYRIAYHHLIHLLPKDQLGHGAGQGLVAMRCEAAFT